MGIWDDMRAFGRRFRHADLARHDAANIALPMPVAQLPASPQSPPAPPVVRGPGPARALAQMRARPTRMTAEEARAAFAATKASLKRVVAPIMAADLFVDWLQEHGVTGYLTVAEVDAWWEGCMDEMGLDHLHPSVLRAELAEVPSCYMGLRRLNGRDYREVKARTGRERAVLYRIPLIPLSELRNGSDAGGWSGTATDAGEGVPRQLTGKRSGKRPANPQKRILSGKESWSCRVFQGSHGDFMPPTRQVAA